MREAKAKTFGAKRTRGTEAATTGDKTSKTASAFLGIERGGPAVFRTSVLTEQLVFFAAPRSSRFGAAQTSEPIWDNALLVNHRYSTILSQTN